MRSLSSVSSRWAAVALSSSRRGPGGRSESRGWRCPTGACKGTERESGARGVVPAPIPALSRVASWADAGHVKSATARTAATAMNFDIVNSVCSTRAEELPVRRIAVAHIQKVMCAKGVAPQKDTHHRHLVSSLPSLKNPPRRRRNRNTRRWRWLFRRVFSGRKNCHEFYLGSLLRCVQPPPTPPRSRLRKPLQATGQIKEFSLVLGSPELPEIPFWGSIL